MLTRPQWANKYAEREEKKLGADFAAETPRGLGLFEINRLPRQERGRLFDARRERFFRRFECAQVRAAKSRVIIELEEMVERTRAPSNTIDALLLKAIFSALYGQAKRKTYAFTFAGARFEFRTDLLVHESAPALPKLSIVKRAGLALAILRREPGRANAGLPLGTRLINYSIPTVMMKTNHSNIQNAKKNELNGPAGALRHCG